MVDSGMTGKSWDARFEWLGAELVVCMCCLGMDLQKEASLSTVRRAFS